MKTLFVYHIFLPDGKGKSAAFSTLKECKWRLMQEVRLLNTFDNSGNYYIATIDFEIDECCSLCFGDGKLIRNYKTGNKFIKCPDCKGRNSIHVLIPSNPLTDRD